MESSAARLFEKEKRMERLGSSLGSTRWPPHGARTNFALLPPRYPLHLPEYRGRQDTGDAYVARGFGSSSVAYEDTRAIFHPRETRRGCVRRGVQMMISVS